MKTLSVCFIVKDEEEVLERILEKVKCFADEIVVVDTGSTDRTVEIAKKYTDKIFFFEWCDDFSKARNFSFSKATCEYLMWLDADDYIFPKDIEKIKKFMNEDEEFDVAYFKYVTNFDKNFKPTFIFERERIVRREMNFKWFEPVHEVLVPFGKIVHKDIEIYHFKSGKEKTGRNLKIYENRIKMGEQLSARAEFYYARELYFNGFYEKAIATFQSFLRRGDAWVENRIEACLNLANCYLAINLKDEALKTLFSSFVYDLPRAEILCKIGEIYFEQDYKKAIYYYKLALKSPVDTTKGGFIFPDFHNFTPSLQLCVLYYKLGDFKKAYKFHKMSKKFKPNHPSVQYNEKVFERLRKEQGID